MLIDINYSGMKMYIKDPLTKAQAVVIWLHGLGSNPEDMAGLAQELAVSAPIRHVFLAAPIRPVTINQGMMMPAWYDILGVSLLDRQDYQGIAASQQLVMKAIEQQLAQGFTSQQIYLAGFSQGAAVALYSALSCVHTLGGLMVLSGYLPCVDKLSIQQSIDCPMFFAMGMYDDVVMPVWSKQSVKMLQEHGFNKLQAMEYPMAHAVCATEIKDISLWLQHQVQSQLSSSEAL